MSIDSFVSAGADGCERGVVWLMFLGSVPSVSFAFLPDEVVSRDGFVVFF